MLQNDDLLRRINKPLLESYVIPTSTSLYKEIEAEIHSVWESMHNKLFRLFI